MHNLKSQRLMVFRISRVLAILWVLMMLGSVVACSGSDKKTDDSDDLIGAPPPPSEDPFYFAAMPAEAVPVAATGTIGPDEPNSKQPRTDDSKSVQCFSCVKVCPVEKGATQCPTRDDLICGWGVHPSGDVAARLAQAECDGALNLIRDNRRWSEIQGVCPIATCE